ncbi:MAG TPA: hypothetical protein PLD59_11485 [Tepidisphaeraceae bacterium]|mgnify:CR=1 FL=1|jgi:hypothetical protein|nr:hypothetical protein [Tepidisphaeraceae bacterium]
MTIDLDPIWQIVQPAELVVRLGGVDYPLRVITVADLRRVASFSAHTREQNASWLVTMFRDGFCPDCVRRFAQPISEMERRDDDLKVLMLMEAIAATWLDAADAKKKVDTISQAIADQIAANRSTGLP